MDIKKVYVDQNEVLGNEVFASATEEVRANDYNPVSYRVFEISSRKEPSAYLIVEGFKMSDVPEGRQKIVFPRGIAIEHRQFRFGGKRKRENVIVAEEMRVIKNK
ncbi:hypothetical protein DDV21_001085 [Streptococcus chenjunshii]|uniref:Single-stranded DNA-binding protein n=1 Tax=Streptococcus chenjunshii TaxID=2173853 RepID=A0A372KKB9_9STRE|nr:hypothetical protein [Streptococcus chenjunshii]AXQ77765.1 hypothetical protein DDV21_001085 [Streptococcus chenjunshii]RFU50487.1 hypothetical protein DDV22_08420 [Streptococcus chenjunshii]RFU52715.1 hypothetical protein DDV23_08260 [Streptococcus chenjunshii]